MRKLVGAVVVPVAALVLLALPGVDAQVRPIYDMGASGLSQALGRLQTTASVLHTGAHPDDEDSAFIARAARGDHARVAYLALNRGEGGQNIIGPELFDALGVIRTEELLQARRLDGAEQLFGHTFDYGFSKSREEATAKWGERDTLADIVRANPQLPQMENGEPVEALIPRMAAANAYLGADVPACLDGRTTLGTGKGEARIMVDSQQTACRPKGESQHAGHPPERRVRSERWAFRQFRRDQFEQAAADSMQPGRRINARDDAQDRNDEP